MAKQKKPKRAAVELTLWDVILSYPDLHNPKPYKGKVYYSTDVLMDEDHPQLAELRGALEKVKSATWGDDKSEWPTDTRFNPGIEDGNAREDSKGYKDRKYIRAKTQQPVPVVGPSGKDFNPQMVKGGMFGNVAVRVSAWENEGDLGVSIYLQGVQIDTSKKGLNFGGGKSVQKMFELGDKDEDDDTESDNTHSDSDDSDDEPRGRKGRASSHEDEDEASTPKKKKRPVDVDDEDSGDDSDDSSDSESDEDDEPPAKKGKKKARNFDEDDDE